jgi:hypothetical protein
MFGIKEQEQQGAIVKAEIVHYAQVSKSETFVSIFIVLPLICKQGTGTV